MKNRLLLVTALLAMMSAICTGCEKKPVTTGNDIAVTGVVLNETSRVLAVGATLTLEATVLPQDATNKEVSWESSDTAIATVADGVVTAIAEGTTKITVTADGGNQAECSVIVRNNAVAVSGMSLDKELVYLSFNVEDNTTLTPTVSPENATVKDIMWTSGDESIVTVADGKLTAVAEGKTTITATTVDGGFTAACEVRVDWLGQTAFFSNKTWSVGEQMWSDVVLASGCSKTTYDGGAYDTYNPQNAYYRADCRMNEKWEYGDLFSWEAVAQYGNRLCPDGWRVPTRQEFIALDKALGGTGAVQYDAGAIISKYRNDWGSLYGGVADSGNNGALNNQERCATYWSQSEFNDDNAHRLVFCIGGELGPDNVAGKSFGMTLRCVK